MTLLEAVQRHADGRKMKTGVTDTAIPGVFIVRAEEPSGLTHSIYKPLACLVLQGGKTVTMGSRAFHFASGDSLIVASETPTVSQITRASRQKPYLAIILELEASIVTELSPSMEGIANGERSIVQVDSTDAEVMDTVMRIVQLLQRPASASLLLPNYRRELHYWLLLGRHGFAVKRYAAPAENGIGIGRSLAILRSQFAEPLSIRDLASAAGMSSSAFYERFREATASTPLQFQKQLRLIEARRLMLAEGWNVSGAAFQVGYESVSQFTREYRRMFAAPPAKDIKAARVELSLSPMHATA